MGIPKVQRLEHVELEVKDLEEALDFYQNVVGLVEIDREANVVYLGCGLDENFDLAVREGGTGVRHFAVRVQDEDELERYARRLKEEGVETSTTDDAEPNQERGLRFNIPTGHEMEFVLVEDNRYLEPFRPALPTAGGFGLLDLDHINLVAKDVRTTVEFLSGLLDFKLSDVTRPDASDPGLWTAAWIRHGDYHHDVAFFITRGPAARRLHHVAFALPGFEQMKVALDRLAAFGHRVEAGPGRHPVGANLFTYFWEPGGNRFELSAEGAILDPRTPVRFWTGLEDTLDAWGNLHERLPSTFMDSS